MKTYDETFNYLQVEAALCVWECLNEWTETPTETTPAYKLEWVELREATGSVEMRHQSIALGQWCLAVYDIIKKYHPDLLDLLCYDWEIIPGILKHAVSDDGKAALYVSDSYVGDYLINPERAALLVLRDFLEMEFFSDCKLEARKQWSYSDLITDHQEKVEQAFTLGESPKEFVAWLGEKYDLTPAENW